MRCVLSATAIVFSLGAAPAVWSQDNQEPPKQTDQQAEQAEKLFKQFDKNGDGQVEGDEVPENRRPLFYRLIRFGDKDDSGSLSKEELSAAWPEQQPRPGDPNHPDQKRLAARDGGNGAGGGKGPGPEQLFERIDVNKDGKIVESEVPEARKQLFQRLGKKADKNGDGGIDRDELTAGLKEMRSRPQSGPRPAELFKSLDTNQDGKLTAEEVPADRRKLFERVTAAADKNGDKSLSQEEFLAGFKAVRQALGNQAGGMPIDPGKLQERMLKLDANGDGKISRDEFDRPGAKRFQQLDKNGDGAVDAEELKAHADVLENELKSVKPAE
jgi:Ca2+-binding EF-hand superfamily protein